MSTHEVGLGDNGPGTEEKEGEAVLVDVNKGFRGPLTTFSSSDHHLNNSGSRSSLDDFNYDPVSLKVPEDFHSW